MAVTLSATADTPLDGTPPTPRTCTETARADGGSGSPPRRCACVEHPHRRQRREGALGDGRRAPACAARATSVQRHHGERAGRGAHDLVDGQTALALRGALVVAVAVRVGGIADMRREPVVVAGEHQPTRCIDERCGSAGAEARAVAREQRTALGLLGARAEHRRGGREPIVYPASLPVAGRVEEVEAAVPADHGRVLGDVALHAAVVSRIVVGAVPGVNEACRRRSAAGPTCAWVANRARPRSSTRGRRCRRRRRTVGDRSIRSGRPAHRTRVAPRWSR